MSVNKPGSNRAKKLRQKYTILMTLGGQCSVCGLKVSWENISVFQLHHFSDNKTFNMSDAHKRSFESILNEMVWCEPMCANCHQTHHANYTIEEITMAQNHQAPWCVEKCAAVLKAYKDDIIRPKNEQKLEPA